MEVWNSRLGNDLFDCRASMKLYVVDRTVKRCDDAKNRFSGPLWSNLLSDEKEHIDYFNEFRGHESRDGELQDKQEYWKDQRKATT